jgi:hypothetical protein
MTKDIADILKDFSKIKEQYELRRTLEVAANDAQYRVEILYCFSNPNGRWVANVSTYKSGGWKSIDDFPWAMEQTEESAIRAALSFIEDRTD